MGTIMSKSFTAAVGGRYLALAAATAGLSACATPLPLAPTFVAMPRQGETFAIFRQNDAECRAFAAAQSGQPSVQARQDQQAGSAVLGAGLGAAVGAAIGSASGHAGNGAAIGAGSGLLLGAALGGQQARISRIAVQRRYDGAYAQCMSAKGERLPEPPRPIIYAAPPVVVAPPVYAYPPPP